MTRIERSLGPSVVADTHTLIWYITALGMLSAPAIRALEDAVAADQSIVIASVTLIELIYIAEKRSDSIDSETLRELLELLEDPESPVTLAPATVDVARAMISIPRAQVRDPFDRVIVARPCWLICGMAVDLHAINLL